MLTNPIACLDRNVIVLITEIFFPISMRKRRKLKQALYSASPQISFPDTLGRYLIS